MKGADRSRQIFVRSPTIMASNKSPAMSPSSSVHCGQYDTMYVTMLGGAYSGRHYIHGERVNVLYRKYMRNELKNQIKSTLEGPYF